MGLQTISSRHDVTGSGWTMPFLRRWKGKERARDVGLDGTVEGTGGEDGVVLSLALVGTGVYDAAYTVPVNMGDANQQFSLQIDTGSSDLWIASTSCSSSSCSLTKGHLYDPSGATQTGVEFSIPYLSGSAKGPIVWDNVTVGGYAIGNQALAAANDVENEGLAPNFSGILGLALPLNSIIATDIPPVTNNNPDGAAWASNLFSLTPVSTAPSSRFLSLALSRPGSNTIPAVFGIGRHPSSIVSDPSLVQYSTLIADKPGILFWKVSVKAITVYVNGTRKMVQLPRSITDASSPVAVLDSGVSVILTTSEIADGIYGAIGINPASDGMYYVPCTTPLNMTITLDDRSETPLHPLDLTAEPPQDNQSQFCIGLIQSADSQLSDLGSSLGDMILGVPFLRNVYTVMAYTAPNADGYFSPVNGTNQTITPRLGLLSLTNSTIALEEFNTVRVLNQPISGGGGSGNSAGGSASGNNISNPTVSLGGKKLSVGIVVLIGILSFFALCSLLFVARWCILRRKYRKDENFHPHEEDVDGESKSSTTTTEVYISKTISKDDKSTIGNNGDDGSKVEEADTAVPGVREAKMFSNYIINRTKVDNEKDGDDAFGVRREQVGDRERESKKSLEDDNISLVQRHNNPFLAQVEDPGHLRSSIPRASSSSSPPLPPDWDPSLRSQIQPPLTPSDHQLNPVLDPLILEFSPSHEPESHGGLEVLDNEDDNVNEDDEVGVRTSMAGVGTAFRSSFLRDVTWRNSMVVGDTVVGAAELEEPEVSASTKNILARTLL